MHAVHFTCRKKIIEHEGREAAWLKTKSASQAHWIYMAAGPMQDSQIAIAPFRKLAS